MNTQDLDRRSFPVELSVRTFANRPPILSGMALPWNTLSEPIREGGQIFYEKFVRGAFSEYLQSGADVRLDVMHDSFQNAPPVARKANGSLVLADCPGGLFVEARLADVTRNRDLAIMVKEKLLSGLSITFKALRDTFEKTGDKIIRTVSKASLPAVAVVDVPAYSATNNTLTIRSLQLFTGGGLPVDAHARRLAEMDRVLAEVGHARRAAAMDHKLREVEMTARLAEVENYVRGR